MSLNICSSTVKFKKMYIYEMPYNERTDVCKLLDQSPQLEELAVRHMQFTPNIIQELHDASCRGASPSDHLLRLWSDHNHTVLELFVLLSRMKFYPAMRTIQSLIEPKYHRLIKRSPKQVDRLDREKVLNGPATSRQDKESASVLQLSELPIDSTGSIPQIQYEELSTSTNNWDDRAVLGRGGFGTVYRGLWKCTQVAIKRINSKRNTPESHHQQIMQSNTELHCLNAYRHDNVLPLYGYSIGGPHPCLVFQYMSGGSLDHRLHIRDPVRVLRWPTRHDIAVGTARGLQFLHTIRDKPLIHGDIKAANILLDPNDAPKIGDFGLAKEGPPISDYIIRSRVEGTRPYLPDEFVKYKKFSTKVDTFSFGVVLFELGTGASAYSNDRINKNLKDHVIMHPGDVMGLKDRRADGGEDVFRKLMTIGMKCVRTAAKDRPEMAEVLHQLENVF